MIWLNKIFPLSDNHSEYHLLLEGTWLRPVSAKKKSSLRKSFLAVFVMSDMTICCYQFL